MACLRDQQVHPTDLFLHLSVLQHKNNCWLGKVYNSVMFSWEVSLGLLASENLKKIGEIGSKKSGNPEKTSILLQKR